MANLLTRYGIKPDLSKRYSISFIDDFVDCSYRSFLSRFMNIYSEDVDLPRTHGQGCHRGLKRINKALQENRAVCNECQFECKLTSSDKVKAMVRTVEECRVKQILLDEYMAEVDEDFTRKLIEKHKQKGSTIAEVKLELENHRRYAMNGMCAALFQKQPVGDVLLTEQAVFGKLAGVDIIAIIDLVLGIRGKSLILDYKTAGSAPTSAFPLRQLSLYIHILEQLEFPVNGIGALYMIKKDPPKKPRAGSKPFKQTDLMFMSVDNNRKKYEQTVSLIEEDINIIQDCISNGSFVRNRRSMYCPCSHAEYCENTAKLDKAVSCGMAGPDAKKSAPDIEV